MSITPLDPLRFLRATLPLLLAACGGSPVVAATPARPPNVIIIMADDLGYGDLGCYGHPTIRTPYLDQMAAEGLRFTDFYAAAAVCTPSRAALLTGRYAVRSGMSYPRGVLFPDSKGGLPPGEITLAEALRERGYATAHIGKWHLGIHEGSRPNDQGFDSSLELPYSNDMDRRADVPAEATKSATPPVDGWNVPLLQDGQIIERPVDQRTLTLRYTEAAVKFIEQAKDRPFFLYFAHTFPHTPVFASPAFAGRSRRGPYGDAVEELDWSVGRVLATLRRLGLAENTFVMFTSDNGPWLSMELQGGSAGVLRNGKGTTWEGGLRVPGIAWWPGRIAPGVSGAVAHTMDLFTTSLALAGRNPPADRPIDGRDLRGLLLRGESPPQQPFFYYRGDQLVAVRLGQHKLHRYSFPQFNTPHAQRELGPLLYDLGVDPAEAHDMSAAHPDLVRQLEELMKRQEAENPLGPGHVD
jgi:arylsulfatase A-like enzyme